MATVTQFVQKYYDLVFKGDPVDEHNMENVEEFLLADDPGSCGYAIINSLFISLFAQKKDLVLVEKVASMTPVLPNQAPQSVWLTTSAKIVGWDSIKKCRWLCKAVGGTAFGSMLDSEIREQVLLKDFAATASPRKQQQITKELGEVLMKQFLSRSEFSPGDPAVVTNIFASRMRSMIQSLSKACKRADHRFVIAGQAYLDQKFITSFVPHGLSRDLLRDLYDFLRVRKAVVLVPKESVAQKFGEKREELIVRAMRFAPVDLNS